MRQNPGDGRLAIYAVSGADEMGDKEFDILLSRATSRRRNRAGKFLKREDACRSLVSEAMLRFAWKNETCMDPDLMALACNAYGKPFLPGSSVHFNIAHSGKWVVCALDTMEVGIDVEHHRDLGTRIAERFFAGPEKSSLQGLSPGPISQKAFFDIWTLKESYVKAIGLGMRCPLDAFACFPDPDIGIVFHPFDSSLPRKSFGILDIESGYSCAVCHSRPGQAGSVLKVALSDLLAPIFDSESPHP